MRPLFESTPPVEEPKLDLIAKLANAIEQIGPSCPYDGTELDIHFHGGVECPTCGAEFELGKNDRLLPSDKTLEEDAARWPDTLPLDRTASPLEIQCAWCKRIKQPDGTFAPGTPSGTVSHGICPDCAAEVQSGDSNSDNSEHTSASANKVWDYPFLYDPESGWLTWGAPNGYHDPIYEQLRGHGEFLPADPLHGRFDVDSGDVRFYSPVFNRMPADYQEKHRELVRRNAPESPPVSPQEARRGDGMDLASPGSDWDDWRPTTGL